MNCIRALIFGKTLSKWCSSPPARLAQLALTLVAAAIAFGPLGARAADVSSIPRDDFWVPDGPVYSVLATNGLLYIGGRFDFVGPTAGTGGAHDLFSAAALPDFPKTDGALSAAIPDGEGGWFVGGQFNTLGGFAIANLGRIRADRTVATNWAPNPNGAVLVMATGPLGLYVGGTFSRISGEDHSLLAALDPATGAVLRWQVDVTSVFGSPTVNALALSGDTLYVGGAFASINGVERWLLAAVHARSGEVLPWFPNDYNTQGANRVDVIAVSERTVYIGGTFTLITQPPSQIFGRNFLAAFDADTAALMPWNPNANGPVSAMALSCDTVYVAGSFTQIGGTARNHLAALDLATGAVRDWNPNANAPVKSLVVSGPIAYVGGMFTQIGGQPRNYLAAVDLASGLPRTWVPKGDFDVSALAVSGNSVFAGGRFSAGGQQRRNVAALDARTGRLAAWNPGANGVVHVLAATTNTVYLGGEFTTISGQPRNRLAAVNALTGQPTSWDPNPSGIVRALAVAGNRVYVGGSITLTNVGGQARNRLAALDIASGAATAWNPNANDEVDAILVDGDTIYIGGRFIRMGGQVRRRLAAVDAASASVRSWDPSANDQVNALAPLDSTVLAAGFFNSVAGQARTNLAGVDAATGMVTAWNPNPHFDTVIGGILRPSSLNAVAVVGSTAYIGGFFDHVGTEPRAFLAAVSTSNPGAARPWKPELDSFVNALATSADAIFVGGNFKNVSGQYRSHLAVFPLEGSPRIVRHPLSQQANIGDAVALEVVATGDLPLSYQWQLNGTNIAGANSSTFTIAGAQVSDSGEYTVVVTNTLGLINSRPATLTVLSPLRIVTHPISQTVPPGTTVTLRVEVEGHPPPIYQWRLNGVNIPGAIYSTLTLSNVQPRDGGTYTVVVANIGGALTSDRAILEVMSLGLRFEDNFAARSTITAANGVGGGNNVGTTSEPNERRHAGKIGGSSVWISWRPTANGIATFSTRGSSFDTLLAVYTGTELTNLEPVAADEDRGGFATSEVSFNATNGVEYVLAIDGLFGASGNILLSWSLDTSAVPFPRITLEPRSQTVSSGTPVNFEVDAVSTTPLRFQWFHGCRLLAAETNQVLIIGGVTSVNVGGYHCLVMNDSTHVAQSTEALLELGPFGDIISQDKLEDVLANLAPGRVIAPSMTGAVSGQQSLALAASGIITVSPGSIDSQIFNNTKSTSSAGERNHCGVLGGASKWFGLQATEHGVLLVDTVGSGIDTVLAVYIGADPLSLIEITCDNNGASDGIRSLVRFNAGPPTNYWLVVDGVNAAEGVINLNWKHGVIRPPPPKPFMRTAHLGQSFTLCVMAGDSFPTPTYQWLFNGRAIVGETNLCLTIPSVQSTNAGTYAVVVRNFAGSATNSFGFIDVAAPTTIVPTLVTNSGVRYLRLSGNAAKKYVVERASGLSVPWLPLYTNNSSIAAPILFTDPQPATSAQRYYRLVPWP